MSDLTALPGRLWEGDSGCWDLAKLSSLGMWGRHHHAEGGLEAGGVSLNGQGRQKDIPDSEAAEACAVVVRSERGEAAIRLQLWVSSAWEGLCTSKKAFDLYSAGKGGSWEGC